MTSPEDRQGDGAWQRIERLLPMPDELPQGPQDPDTELHAMSGPALPTPQWVVDSWKRAAAERQARRERGEIRIPGVPRKGTLHSRSVQRKVVSFRDVVGDEVADKYIEDARKDQEEAQRRRMRNPAYRRMIYHMTRRIG